MGLSKMIAPPDPIHARIFCSPFRVELEIAKYARYQKKMKNEPWTSECQKVVGKCPQAVYSTGCGVYKYVGGKGDYKRDEHPV